MAAPVTPNKGISLECPICHHTLTRSYDYTAQRNVYTHKGTVERGENACPNFAHVWYLDQSQNVQFLS